MYGMIPDTGRGIAYFVMFSLAALQVLARGVTVALLGVTSMRWLLYYLGGDMLLFLLYKVLRRDMIYFLPLPTSVAVPGSLLLRVIAKTITDFTGCMLFRLSYEMGGAYFTFSMATSIASVPVISYSYSKYAKAGEDGAQKVGDTELWVFNIGMVVAWVAIFGFFMARIVVPRFRKAFRSTQTGWQKSESIFLDNDEDSKRMYIFTDNVVLWSGIKEDVKAWTMSSWETWDREKPEWFTQKVIASIPDEFIPPRFLAIMGGARERRGSAAGSVRESMRRGSSYAVLKAAAAAAVSDDPDDGADGHNGIVT
jgi:hypothetical protein